MAMFGGGSGIAVFGSVGVMVLFTVVVGGRW